ncbi:Predicted amidohydrolase [Sphingobacterium nematocida]|uniref:Predicted amidohydrolase n=1 Tax=Sphingobacterium nematocida TaxID=1513896 RepID=A0A1T5F633_9SPHI|nr:nitrilase-related carbon-nitrogen hydrolase [Sphingobacterium nematocida]SKB91498.1 Predicted amidohydrolase [Sphingobacterium nematocida]
MRVGFFQYAVIWRDRDANLSYIESRIKGQKFDLLVLPELFTSGYAYDYKGELLAFAEDLSNSPTIRFFTRLMQHCGGYITGTIPELYKGKLYNSSILVGAEGLVASYRKIHVTDYEKRAFQPGREVVWGQCQDAKVGLTICFDAWFAPLSSMLKAQGVDIICNSANFGGEITPTIIPIRAIENQCFYINCNRVGSELFEGEEDAYRGESQIVSPDGKILAKADNKESLTFIDIDLAEVNHPAFGSLITKDFVSEHRRYKVEIQFERL